MRYVRFVGMMVIALVVLVPLALGRPLWMKIPAYALAAIVMMTFQILTLPHKPGIAVSTRSASARGQAVCRELCALGFRAATPVLTFTDVVTRALAYLAGRGVQVGAFGDVWGEIEAAGAAERARIRSQPLRTATLVLARVFTRASRHRGRIEDQRGAVELPAARIAS
jgi:hypothetical protein